LIACFASGCGQSAATEQTTSPRALSRDSTINTETDQPASSAVADAPPAAEPVASAEPQTPPPTHAAAPPAPGDTAKAKAAPADRTPTKPGDAEKITFDDLNLGMQADVVFRDFMVSPRVQELEGKRISIVGYMHPPETQRGIKKFILLKNTQCKFGPGGQADHLADVSLRADHSTVFTPSPLKVEGTLKLAPFQGPDGNTWSIYRLEDAVIR
jgi:hypothetical protein